MFRCLMCRAESKLLAYESLLFSVSNKNKYTPADENKEKDGETMYESTSKGFWKMSQKEFLLLSKLSTLFKWYFIFNDYFIL